MRHALSPDLVAALADRYSMGRQLGQGGMAAVYLAEDLKHGRNVAIKIVAEAGASHFDLINPTRVEAHVQRLVDRLTSGSAVQPTLSL